VLTFSKNLIADRTIVEADTGIVFLNTTVNLSLVEHDCVKFKCDDFSLYVSAIYLALDVEKRAYELFVEDIEASQTTVSYGMSF
jgi:hypothetical protein